MSDLELVKIEGRISRMWSTPTAFMLELNYENGEFLLQAEMTGGDFADFISAKRTKITCSHFNRGAKLHAERDKLVELLVFLRPEDLGVRGHRMRVSIH